jgi:hypothetical protein
MQEYKIDLLAVQEVRWLGRSIIEKDCRIYYSCDDEKNIFGAGFIASKHIRSRVIICKPIDMRLWIFRIRGKFKNYRFVCARVPTEGRVKDRRIGYMRLKRMYKQFPSYNIKNMNAELGKEICAGIAVSTCGLHDEVNFISPLFFLLGAMHDAVNHWVYFRMWITTSITFVLDVNSIILFYLLNCLICTAFRFSIFS